VPAENANCATHERSQFGIKLIFRKISNNEHADGQAADVHVKVYQEKIIIRFQRIFHGLNSSSFPERATDYHSRHSVFLEDTLLFLPDRPEYYRLGEFG
jgi:hypothetical protein